MKKYLLLCLLFTPFSSWADSFTDIQVDVNYNDNISFGTSGNDILSDFMLTPSVVYGIPVALGNGTLTYLASLDTTVHKTYSQLNHVRFLGGISFKDKFGMGDVPWYTLGAKVGYNYSADNLRDASFAELDASIGKHLNDELTIGLAYALNTQKAKSTVFDTTTHALSLTADYLLTDNIQLLTSYTYMKGDIVATTRPNASIIAQSNGIVADPAFGAGRFAYKLKADRIQIIKLGGNYYLSDNSAIEVNIQVRDAKVGYLTDYTSNIYTVSYIFNF